MERYATHALRCSGSASPERWNSLTLAFRPNEPPRSDSRRYSMRAIVLFVNPNDDFLCPLDSLQQAHLLGSRAGVQKVALSVMENVSEVCFRLHGSRLAAGWVDVAAGAEAAGVDPGDLETWENGQKKPNRQQITQAAATFQVSSEFILRGGPATARERLAERLAAILRSADGRLDVLAQEWPKRLKFLREKHPFEDIDDAAYNCGRLLQTILKHEREEIPQNIDFQIGYALALRARPEFAVLTVLPLHPRPNEQVEWWEPLPASSMRLLGKDIGKEWMRKLANAFEGIC